VLAEMRAGDPPVHYLVDTPKGRLSRYEKALLEQPWQAVRDGVQVKLLAQEGELYVLAEKHLVPGDMQCPEPVRHRPASGKSFSFIINVGHIRSGNSMWNAWQSRQSGHS
jgi:hypothetical protein